MPSAVVTSTTPATDKDAWRTPPELFARAARRYGSFTLDAAASAENRLCERWFGPGSPFGEDALALPWGDGDGPPERVWCNPPYTQVKAFVAKAAEEARAGRAHSTLLLPSTTDVRWWQQHVWQETGPRPGVLVEFLSPRVRFLRPDGSPAGSPNFGSVLVTFLARGAR